MTENHDASFQKDRGAAFAGTSPVGLKHYLVGGGIVVVVAILVVSLVWPREKAEGEMKGKFVTEEFGTGVNSQLLSPPPELDARNQLNEGANERDQKQLITLKAIELIEMERQAKLKSLEKRNKAPLFAFYSLASPASAVNVEESLSDDPNQRFLEQSSKRAVKTAQASKLDNISTLVPQGTLISAVLETAIQSDLPGMVRAMVNRSVYSFDNENVLIPQGSRVIGQYRSGIQRGQSRVFVIWERVITPDGTTVQLASPGTDTLGRAGLAGERDTHFMERFGSSILLSLIDGSITAGTNAVNDEGVTTLAVETGQGANRAAEIALENSIAIPPTIHVEQGEPIRIFVAQDLDFSQVK